MRLFELLLFLSNIGLFALTVLLTKGRRKIPIFAASGIATLLLIIHGAVEGFRWQLFFVYGLTIIFLAISSYSYFKKSEPPKLPRFMLGSAYAAIAAMLAATAGLLYVFPVSELPEPTGEFKVGTQTFHFVDTNREEIFGETRDGKRELMVQVWYPAQAGTGKYAPFIPDTRILRYMAANYGLPGFTFQHLKYVSAHAYSGAEVSAAQTSYPLILANPGFGSSRFLHTSQAENLASHGYIVAVIDHTYNTFATEFPDGRITTSTTNDLFSPDHDYRTERESRDKLGKVLTDDVAFALDQFELIQSGQMPSRLTGRMDLGRVGVFGHSIGGATAYDASYDPRIAAGIDLDGGLYRLRDREELGKPFLFIQSESNFEKLEMVKNNRVYTDVELKSMGSTREWEDQVTEDKKRELERMREAVGAGGQVLYIDNAEHLNFTDVQFISPIFNMLGVTGKLAPERASSVINAYMLDFFDRYLKNQGGSLMKGPDSRFPEMKFAASLF
ncbi:Platelet-activating factor acetylhydrolase, isoform II [Paenibacillus sp. UNCCL117]|uniref:alpha/beta hydrolase family protein n=1 Tax=unclassified Paenibacillus TaxID=185978 RepID=UPI00088170D8|nr:MULTISPECIES: dienelactone hydrolase [unclassified Paenibacillus]SDE15342.1 Platelet-activating factor acetylhydrolase, isoform II [Paenibacillus sp. cl123]SFW60867.1 Platelet-activating factor acetylhydrolase, isoform II [Paenibacillus sp. UNCCL117]